MRKMRSKKVVENFKQQLIKGNKELEEMITICEKRFEETNDYKYLGQKVHIQSNIQERNSNIEILKWVLKEIE